MKAGALVQTEVGSHSLVGQRHVVAPRRDLVADASNTPAAGRLQPAPQLERNTFTNGVVTAGGRCYYGVRSDFLVAVQAAASPHG
jgi:hypothetical protein